MEISELQRKLKESHVHFIGTVNRVADADFTKSVNQKWTAGQQLDHIIKSVAPVNLALALPAFALKMSFGKANRPSRTYDQLVEKYQGKLSAGGRAPGRFVPASISVSQRAPLISKLEKLVGSLSARIEGFSEEATGFTAASASVVRKTHTPRNDLFYHLSCRPSRKAGEPITSNLK
jgi:hypothetical protein